MEGPDDVHKSRPRALIFPAIAEFLCSAEILESSQIVEEQGQSHHFQGIRDWGF